ncbi:hypothetical protein FSP39_017306 [Pinctada imbricata]|uniref:Reverse transcriptase domain-containing protein n=1 Tax=Pinctada imbricata TaxID=66713 RepID=A0AA88YLA4_PINIB|nr:hypothetical protein FSP39_017306 [Pinctada imbricata]
MEKFIRDAIMSHMENNNLFTTHQHGFRKKRSCVTQLIEVIEDWTRELDKGNNIDSIYLDFQKAFDKVPHKRLTEKRKGYGISGCLLTDRKQRVVLNGSESEWTDVTSGIPQGSVLGPTLFLLYINDLPDVVNNIVKLFADDTKLYSVVNTNAEQDRMQNDIDKLQEWSDKWLLKFNTTKCKHLHLGNSPAPIYYMNHLTLEHSTCEKDLGISIDSKLKFQEHINKQIKKANSKLGIIRRSLSYLDKNIFLTLYKSIVRPHLEYGSSVWSVIYKKEAIGIENVQRRATKLIRSISHLTYPERLKTLGLPTLQYRRLRADMIQVYRILKGVDTIQNHTNILPISNSITRGHSLKISKQYCRTNVRKFSFSQRIVDCWNALPDNVVNATSVNSFKSQINKYWKDFNLKFVPDCYEPEAERNTTRRNGSERQCL